MQKTTIGLAGLNLALAGYLAITAAHYFSGKQTYPPSCDPALTGADPTSAPVRPASFSARPVQAKSPWALIASADLRKYAENLRRVGCPEETIKEIMLAEVNRLYGSRERALKVRPDDVAPWETAATYDRRSGETKLRQLLEEKRALMKELTGVDVGIDMPSRLAGRDVEKFQAAFTAIPDAKRDQVRAIQENYWAQSDDIKQRTLGYLEPEDREDFLRIKTERRDALAKVLTPRELQDYELATSETANTLRNRFNGFDVSDDEFRKILDYEQPLDEKFSLNRRNPDPVNDEFTTARTQAEKDVQDYMKSVLGDDRYAELQRSKDPVYQGIKQAGTAAGLSGDAILQAYQAQQQIQNQTRTIMQDPNLSPEQRTQSLNDARAAAQQRFQQILGDKAPQFLQQVPDARLLERYGIQVNPAPVLPNPAVKMAPNAP